MVRILERSDLVPDHHQLVVEAPQVARTVQPGQFVILRPDEQSERIPISVSDFDRAAGTVTCVFLEAGATTMKLARLRAGDTLPTFMGPLGTPSEIGGVGRDGGPGTVVCCGGCYGIGAIYPLVRAYKEAGNRVISVLEAHSHWLLYWVDKHRAVADEVHVVTSDGSSGRKGLSFDLLREWTAQKRPMHRIHAVGCTFMMSQATAAVESLDAEFRVALNPVMVDGTGMCGGCRCQVKGEKKFACVDGPEFDGRGVDWDGLVARRRSYRAQELAALRRHESRGFLLSSGAVQPAEES